MHPNQPTAPEQIQSRILILRGHRVLLDADLAAFYGVPTHRFNEAVKRNGERFPADFRFQLTREEFVQWLQHAGQPGTHVADGKPAKARSSQFAMTSSRFRAASYLPWAFTEHGALMAANVLNSPRAVQVSLIVIRAFVALRQMVASHQALAEKLGELEARVGEHDEDLAKIVEAIRQLTAAPGLEHGRKIGFHEGNR